MGPTDRRFTKEAKSHHDYLFRRFRIMRPPTPARKAPAPRARSCLRAITATPCANLTSTFSPMAWPASCDVEKTYTARTKSSGQTACSLIHSRFRDLARFLRPRTNQGTRAVNAPLSGESWDHVGHAADVNSAARRENNAPSWPLVGLEQLKLSSRGPRLNSPRHYSGAPVHSVQLVYASSTLARTEPDPEGRLFGLICAAAVRACLASAPPMNRVRPSGCADAGRRTAG